MDRSSEERSRFEKWASEHGTMTPNANALAWIGWKGRAALEDRQEAALEAPWVCPTCGAMVIGNRIYCFNCAERGLYTTRPGVSSEATPTEIETWKLDCQRRGGEIVYAETADQIRATTVVGTNKFVQTDTQQVPAPAPEVQGTPTKRMHADNCGVSQSGRAVHTCLSPCPCWCHTAPVAPTQTLAETPEDIFSLGSDHQAVARKREYKRGYSVGAAKALADYRNWLWNQQGRATLSEQHQELLKREREAGGVGGEERV